MIFNSLRQKYENKPLEIQKKVILLAVFLIVLITIPTLLALIFTLIDDSMAPPFLPFICEFILLLIAFGVLNKGHYRLSVNIAWFALLTGLILRYFTGADLLTASVSILAFNMLLITLIIAFLGTSKKQISIISGIGILVILLYFYMELPPSLQETWELRLCLVFFMLITGFGFLTFQSYKNSIQKTEELALINRMLHEEMEKRETAEQEIKVLGGMLPICSVCKKIRDDKGYWNQLESYIHAHSEAEFSHSICPDCAKKTYPDFFDQDIETV